MYLRLKTNAHHCSIYYTYDNGVEISKKNFGQDYNCTFGTFMLPMAKSTFAYKTLLTLRASFGILQNRCQHHEITSNFHKFLHESQRQ